MVAQKFFQQRFGLVNPDGTKNNKRTTDVTANVVSVLQAGAFFGALGSAPISSEYLFLMQSLFLIRPASAYVVDQCTLDVNGL